MANREDRGCKGHDVNKNRVEAAKLLIGYIVLKCGRHVLSFEDTMDVVYKNMGKRKGE